MNVLARAIPPVQWGGGLSLPIDMEWARPLFSRNKVDWAGRVISTPDRSYEEWRQAIEIVNNWRSSHSYPLNCFQTNLRDRARKIDPKALVSQRLKRFDSIVKKLNREQTATLQLAQMQDIGGCRAVLSTTDEVFRLARAYQRGPKGKWLHELTGPGKNYIAHPKPDGYRGVHLIFRYIGTHPNVSWDRLRIEMQLRSAHQHAWATAVEAVDIFTRQALKANRGNQQWQRFFALMGSAIAAREGLPWVPDTPTNAHELRSELVYLERQLNALDTLQGFRHAIQFVHQRRIEQKAAYYLLHLMFEQHRVSWTEYPWNASQEANADYTKLEQETADKAGEHVVLVKAGPLAEMKRSYPSYFLDTDSFIRLAVDALLPGGLEPKEAGV
jgi:ppGpp synthetase/RelA/SpoT-type nucleotidyltranferase